MIELTKLQTMQALTSLMECQSQEDNFKMLAKLIAEEFEYTDHPELFVEILNKKLKKYKYKITELKDTRITSQIFTKQPIQEWDDVLQS